MVSFASFGAACGADDNAAVAGDSGDSLDGSRDGAMGDTGIAVLDTGGDTIDSGTSIDGAMLDGAVADTAGDDAGTFASPSPVNLRSAGDYVILAKSAISTVPNSAITGNLGLSPAAASYITGFPLKADSSNLFSTTPQVTGEIFAADYAAPTPTNLTTAIGDMQLAFTDAAAAPPTCTSSAPEISAGGPSVPASTHGEQGSSFPPT